MALPIQSAPTYTTTLPSSGEEVKYRPFLVKEQKILVIAKESEDTTQVLNSIKDLLRSVTFDKIDPDNIPTVDLEWLFVKVRSVSVGETSKVVLACQHNDCNGSGDVVINLDKVRVENSNPDETNVMINTDVGVKLRYPTLKDLNDIQTIPEAEQATEIVKRSMVYIFDAENVYQCNELSRSELDEFVDSLTFGQLAQLGEFFDKLPKLVYEVQYPCNMCDRQSTRTLEGIQSFF